MKKIVLVIISAVLLLTLFIFIFIPGKIVISESKIVGTTPIGFDTCLHNLEKWKQWWPGTSKPAGTDSVFLYDGYTFRLSVLYTDGATILISSGQFTAEAQIKIITFNRDSVSAEYRTVLAPGNNPIKRISQYLVSRKLKKSMNAIFGALCHFAGQTENIYDHHIERTTFTELNLISSRFESSGYPGTSTIYQRIDRLREYLRSQSATEKYYPMMNIKQKDSTHFVTMIAISVDRIIPESGEFFMSKMVRMENRFLKTEATGGPSRIEKAHQAVEKYMSDHALSAPAIPFEILVTERNKVTDTTAWKTIIFYPSM